MDPRRHAPAADVNGGVTETLLVGVGGLCVAVWVGSSFGLPPAFAAILGALALLSARHTLRIVSNALILAHAIIARLQETAAGVVAATHEAPSRAWRVGARAAAVLGAVVGIVIFPLATLRIPVNVEADHDEVSDGHRTTPTIPDSDVVTSEPSQASPPVASANPRSRPVASAPPISSPHEPHVYSNASPSYRDECETLAPLWWGDFGPDPGSVIAFSSAASVYVTKWEAGWYSSLGVASEDAALAAFASAGISNPKSSDIRRVSTLIAATNESYWRDQLNGGQDGAQIPEPRHGVLCVPSRRVIRQIAAEQGTPDDSAQADGRVEVTGDAIDLTLEGEGGRFKISNGRQIPAGTYTLVARFDDREQFLFGTVTVRPGAHVAIRCSRELLHCAVTQEQRPVVDRLTSVGVVLCGEEGSSQNRVGAEGCGGTCPVGTVCTTAPQSLCACVPVWGNEDAHEASLANPNDAPGFVRQAATSGCKWFGTAPFCEGECPSGSTEIARHKCEDNMYTCGSGEKACLTGTKAYCCPP